MEFFLMVIVDCVVVGKYEFGCEEGRGFGGGIGYGGGKYFDFVLVNLWFYV